MKSLIIPALNLGVLIFFIYYKGKKPFIDFVASRGNSIGAQVKSARDRIENARRALSESIRGLSDLSSEIAIMQKETLKRKQELEVSILTNAKNMASMYVSDAKTAIELSSKAAEQEIAKQFVNHLMIESKKTIQQKMSEQEANRLLSDYSQRVVGRI